LCEILVPDNGEARPQFSSFSSRFLLSPPNNQPEGSSTEFTLIWFLSRMSPLVVPYFRFTCEGFAAHSAHERFVAGVNDGVDFQVSRRPEALAWNKFFIIGFAPADVKSLPPRGLSQPTNYGCCATQKIPALLAISQVSPQAKHLSSMVSTRRFKPISKADYAPIPIEIQSHRKVTVIFISVHL